MKKRILVTVKAYPQYSSQYGELVCTAGISEKGEWIRIYPVPFRKLDEYEQYRKYTWIELDLTKNTRDFRPESYRPVDIDNIDLSEVEHIGTSDKWRQRKELILTNIHSNLDELIEASKKPSNTSLVTFKPSRYIGFTWSKRSKEKIELSPKKIAKIKQASIFDDSNKIFKNMPPLPYDFYYKFSDNQGVVSKMKILDWEIGALYWKSLKRYNHDEEKACEKVKEKFWHELAINKDLYLFLGTTKEMHRRRLGNPFTVIGVFYPPVDNRVRLF